MNQASFCPAPCLPECPATCRYALIPPTATAVASTARNPNRIYTLDPLFNATFASLAIGLLAMCSYTIHLKYYSVGRRPRHRTELIGQVRQESNHLELDKYVTGGTVQMYVKDDGLFREVEYPVCLSELQYGEILRILPKCNHAFHMSCIDVWLGSHKSCPLCRAIIVSDVLQKPASEHHINVDPVQEI